MTLLQEGPLVMEDIPISGYERVIKITDDTVGLKAIISMHNTALGPALGGTRIYPYRSFNDALDDVLRLSKGMTYKSALTQSGSGGGKSVIITDPKKGKSKELLHSFGKAVSRLKGSYICAEDVGCTPADIATMSEVNPYLVGLESKSGNPSPFTSWGTFRGIQSVLYHLYGKHSVKGKVIALQGLGSVGMHLAETLICYGAEVVVSDVNTMKAQMFGKKHGVQVVSPDKILEVPCDVLAPCALGGIIHAGNIPKLNCNAIAGCANNQLLEDMDGERLKEKGILYAPDFVINSGGLINVIYELAKEPYSAETSRKKINGLYDQLLSIYELSDKNGVSSHRAAMDIGNYRLKHGIGKRETPFHFSLLKKG